MKKILMLFGGLALLLASCSKDEGLAPSSRPDFSGITAFDPSQMAVGDSVKITYRDMINARIQQLEAADDGANSDSDAYAEELEALRKSLHRVDSIEHAFTDSLGMAYGTNSDSEGYLELTLKKFYYTTKSADGTDVMLTALLGYSVFDWDCFPFYTKIYYKPNCMLIGCHATITSNSQSPTRLMDQGSWTILKSDVGQILMDGRSTFDGGFEGLMVIPDYQGWGGTTSQNHPYLMQEATARQVTDAATQALEWFTKNCTSMEDDWRTAIIGFSQGGSTAMATMKHIEQTPGLSDQLRLAGAVCGDGPYDPLATMKHYVSENRINMPSALALIVLGACDYDEGMKNYKQEDFMTEQFLNTGIIDAIRAKDKNTGELDDLVKANGLSCYEGNYWHMTDLLRPEIVDYFAGKEVDEKYRGKCEALYNALNANNLANKGWAPSHHLVVFHATDDPTVPIDNYWSVARTMNNGNFMGIRDNEPDVRGAQHTSIGTRFYTVWDKGLLEGLLDKDYYNDSRYWRPGLWTTDKYNLNSELYSADQIPE